MEVAPVLEVPRAEGGGTELSICERPFCGHLRNGAPSSPGQFAQPVDGSLPEFLDQYSTSSRMAVLTLVLPRGYFTRGDVKETLNIEFPPRSSRMQNDTESQRGTMSYSINLHRCPCSSTTPGRVARRASDTAIRERRTSILSLTTTISCGYVSSEER